MDIGTQDLWDHYHSMADEDQDGKLFLDTSKIDTTVRAGMTDHPMVTDLEVGDYMPPLHCYIRFLCFFIEMAVRFRANNQMHGHISDEMKKKMVAAKNWFREEALKNLERRYCTPCRGGGSTDTGNAAR